MAWNEESPLSSRTCTHALILSLTHTHTNFFLPSRHPLLLAHTKVEDNTGWSTWGLLMPWKTVRVDSHRSGSSKESGTAIGPTGVAARAHWLMFGHRKHRLFFSTGKFCRKKSWERQSYDGAGGGGEGVERNILHVGTQLSWQQTPPFTRSLPHTLPRTSICTKRERRERGRESNWENDL